MNQDSTFRVVLVFGALIVFPIMVYHWFLFLAGGLTFVLMVVRTTREEQRLVARFGDAYRSYMERTGRFVPKIGAIKPSA